MNGKMLVIEGLDGAGKSTQLGLLKNYFDSLKIKYKDVHFPKLNEGLYGNLIAEFLRGEFGNLDEVHPKLVALLFANDRKEHIEEIIEWINQGYVVLADRYVNSNIAFQCAKCKSLEEKKNLKEWILAFEFNYNLLPKPHISFFLDVPFKSIISSLSKQRVGDDRNYLNGKKDIHEASITFQEKVYNEYQKMIVDQDNFHSINCYDEKGGFRTAEAISSEIIKTLSNDNIL